MNLRSLHLMQFRYVSIVLVLFLAAALTSCWIDKRHYRSGLYIDWNNNRASTVNETQMKSEELDSVQKALPDTVVLQSKIGVSVDKSELQSETESYLPKKQVQYSSTPQIADSLQHAQSPTPVSAETRYDESDDLKLGLYALVCALAGFLLITFLFEMLPVIVPTLIAAIGFLAAIFFLVLSVKWHVRRNRKRKEASEATTHRELGRRILHALLVVATVFLAAFSLLLAVFLTDW